MQKKKNNHRGVGKSFFGLVGAVAAVYAILSFYPEFLERGKIEKQAGLERKLETKVVQTAEVRKINDPNTLSYVVKETPKKNQDISYKTNDFSKDSDEVLLARMLYGEARNCSKEERIEIAFTPINRALDRKKWNGKTIKEAILCPWQYSCFNKNDVNLKELKDPLRYDAKSFKECLGISKEVLSGKYKELNMGQTHYFNPKMCHPSWVDSDKMIFIPTQNTIHKFYIEK